jgi:hypothetical protein
MYFSSVTARLSLPSGGLESVARSPNDPVSPKVPKSQDVLARAVLSAELDGCQSGSLTRSSMGNTGGSAGWAWSAVMKACSRKGSTFRIVVSPNHKEKRKYLRHVEVHKRGLVARSLLWSQIDT